MHPEVLNPDNWAQMVIFRSVINGNMRDIEILNKYFASYFSIILYCFSILISFTDHDKDYISILLIFNTTFVFFNNSRLLLNHVLIINFGIMKVNYIFFLFYFTQISLYCIIHEYCIYRKNLRYHHLVNLNTKMCQL